MLVYAWLSFLLIVSSNDSLFGDQQSFSSVGHVWDVGSDCDRHVKGATLLKHSKIHRNTMALALGLHACDTFNT